MGEQITPGLPADWLNGWLAAIGITVLVPDVRLGWTDEPVPRARFSVPGDEPLAELVAAHLPSVDELEQLVIAELPQNITPEQFRKAAEAARNRRDASLSVLTTDVSGAGRGGGLPNGPFNVGAPRGETLYTRLRACRQRLDGNRPLAELVHETLAGRARRQELNGLGFDYRRIAGSVPGEAAKLVDPVVECLCFYALQLHPVGGDGERVQQRGWTSRPARKHAFRWPVWSNPLNQSAIDALLDIVYRETVDVSSIGPQHGVPQRWRRLGVTGLYGTVPFQQTGSSDTTRGYASEHLA